AAYELNMDPADFRLKNFIRPEQFPYHTPTGFVYDSGQYAAALQKALDEIDYAGMPQEKEEAREDGKLVGVGIASFTEAVGAGPSKDYDIPGLKMFDSAALPLPPPRNATQQPH